MLRLTGSHENDKTCRHAHIGPCIHGHCFVKKKKKIIIRTQNTWSLVTLRDTVAYKNFLYSS